MAGTPTFLPRSWRLLSSCLALAWTTTAYTVPDRCPVYFESPRICDPIAPRSFLPASVRISSKSIPGPIADKSVFADLIDALNATQAEFFAPWLGTWPSAIDWTAAVVGTHVSAAIRSITEDAVFLNSEEAKSIDWKRTSNLLDGYFAELIAYYFGQDALAIRTEAYDDMLWVVLGWLETVKFINTHNGLHYTHGNWNMPEAQPDVDETRHGGHSGLFDGGYHGNMWIPSFSHRARVFWDLASHGWDTKLCNGGMIWNPRLPPYKNAITNELYVAASISMYLHFPGDDNRSPFQSTAQRLDSDDPVTSSSRGLQDAKFLKAAVDGYRWLRGSNMTNEHGLFVDGFHISGYIDQNSNNTSCDLRDEMVFSYNQGVILSGMRGLWDASGAPSFLIDGHKLIQNVINATGYSLAADRPFNTEIEAGILPPWHGLGRLGVMEEACDASATCSQDGQTFKGIFFHHLVAFCAQLRPPTPGSGLRFHRRAFAAVRKSHAEACRSYVGWLAHNVHAAQGTRDASGRFGQWWTAGLLSSNWTGAWPTRASDGISDQPNATDYRNYGVPNDTTWRTASLTEPLRLDYSYEKQSPLGLSARDVPIPVPVPVSLQDESLDDPNNRGRGRTVETQSGGLGLLRAYWEIARLR
ncbi:glycoside hydrolase family 76 protein [Xylaria nigripes]|nr:glycoside hydrolase family 76 protein [Xylaria nigripes]